MNTSSADSSQTGSKADVKQPYQEQEFAAREAQIRLVGSRLGSAAQEGAKNLLNLIEFCGIVGLGKTWLLEHLSTIYSPRQDPPTASALITFERYSREQDWYALLQDLIRSVKDQVPDLDIAHFERDQVALSERSELSRRFVELIESLQGSYVPLLLFDASERSSGPLLEWLEDEIVYPLLRTDRVVFVFAGRRGSLWKRFEVRKRRDTVLLEPFDRQRGIPEMLRKLGVDPSLAPAICQYTFGHPLTTRVILDALPKVSERSLAQNQSVIADTIHARVIEGYFFQGLDPELRFLLWVVCIPRKFADRPLKAFASRFEPVAQSDYGEKQGGFYWQAIRDMQDTALVQWSTEQGGYVLPLALRRIMAKNLEMRNPSRFRAWHRAAVKQYDEWIERHPRNAVGFLIERAFHQAWVLQAEGLASSEIAHRTSEDLIKTWEKVSKEPDVEWDLPDMIENLNEKIQNDDEIKDDFPKVYDRLVRRVKDIHRQQLGTVSTVEVPAAQ